MLLSIMQTTQKGVYLVFTQKWECAAVSYFLKCDYHCIFRVRLADRMIPESRRVLLRVNKLTASIGAPSVAVATCLEKRCYLWWLQTFFFHVFLCTK